MHAERHIDQWERRIALLWAILYFTGSSIARFSHASLPFLSPKGTMKGIIAFVHQLLDVLAMSSLNILLSFVPLLSRALDHAPIDCNGTKRQSLAPECQLYRFCTLDLTLYATILIGAEARIFTAKRSTKTRHDIS